ncbi:unnamed protein product [Effrenium voratum]|uniref:Uncharacterized protein n=1 Tax=Effrenium voratum TaxID=2562239 RepID=A0AA36IMQ0_9DINO|nr:unnamed protein product [Effrenium voratum]
MSKIQQQISESLVATRGASLQTEVFRRAHSGLAEGMLVKVEDVNKEQFAEVLELSNGTEPPAKVRFLNATKADSWLCLKSLAIPDYAAVQVGLQVNVNYGGIWMLGSVIAINHAFTRSPVQVKVHGLPPGATKWVGADELRSKAIKFLPANLADGTENGPAGSGKRNVSVCCRWLAGTCLRAESHSMFNNLYLHEDVPGIPCALGHECKFRHFETRGLPSHPGSAEASSVGASCQNVEAPRAKNPGPGEARWKPVALASNLGRAQGRAGPRATADAPGLSDLSASSQLPWTSLDADPEGLEHGLQAAIDALEALLQVSAAAPEELAKLQQAARSQLVRPILEAHSWTGSQFASDADLHAVLAQLKVAKAEVDDDVTSCSDQSEHEESDFEENLSTCAESAGLETLERRLAAQQEEFREITGVLVFGTFRCVSGDKQHSNSGEVLVERGPRLLLGRRVRVIGSCRAAAFDQDQVYLRLLMARTLKLQLGRGFRGPVENGI